MANLSNINNKLIVTDGGNLLVNSTANLATYGGITIDNFSDPSIAMKTTGASGWLWTQYITNTGTNNFSMGVNQTAPYWCVKAGAGMDSPHLVVNSSGNVGIGTISPGSKLQVEGANTSSIPLVNLIASGTGSFQRGVRLLNGGMNAGDELMYAVGRSDNSRNMGQVYFYYAGDGSTSNRISMGLHSVDDVFNILGTGNVGIGTASPSATLNIKSLNSSNSDSLSDVITNSEFKLQYRADDLSSMYLGGLGSERGYLQSINNAENAGTSFSLNPYGGNVGIGTTSPGAKLEINDGSTQTELRISVTGDAGYSTINFSDASDINPGQIYYHHQENLMNFRTNDVDRMRVDSTGVLNFLNTASSTGGGGSIAHYTNNYMYIKGGTGGLAIGDDGFNTNIYLNNDDSIQFGTGGSERTRITSSGNSFFNYTNSTIETYGSGVYGGKVVIKASGAEALALMNNSIGGTSQVALNFTNEFVANQYNFLARIIAEPEQSWTGTASTRDARLSFFTAQNGTAGEKMRITSDGSLARNSKKIWNFTASKSFTEGTSSISFFRLNFNGNTPVYANITLMSNNSATGSRTMQSVQAMLSVSYQGYLPTMTEISKTSVSNNGSSYISAVQGANGSLTFLCDTTNNTTGTSNTTFVSVELISNGALDASITVL